MMSPHFTPIRSSISSRQMRPCGGDRAFTLVELMVVLLIGLIITAMTIPAISSMMQSMNLNQAGQLVSGQINLAAQIAGSRGYPVEVRLIQAPGAKYFIAMQLFTTTGGVATPVNHPLFLPPSAVISGNVAVLSPYLQNLQGGTAGTSTLPTMTIAGITYSYESFRISSQGLVLPFAANPNPNTPFANTFLTVVPFNQASVAAAPTNYYTVQINPATGLQLTYRPGGI